MMQNRSSQREQRTNARAVMACPVYIHGLSAGGGRIKAYSVTDNICQDGLFLQIPQSLPLGSSVFTIIQMFHGAKLAARGMVVRVEKKSPNLSGLAVRFTKSRLIAR